MKKIIQPLLFLLLFLMGSQLVAQDIDFTVRFNPSTGNYEVHATPTFTDPTYFVGGGSQISLVLPNSIADAGLVITTVNGGFWSDNSQVYAPAADPTHDFHSIASNGSQIAFVAGEEILLYTFTLPGGGCIGGIRLFENPTDPNSTAPGMGGGDFLNYFASAFTFVDAYNANYDNTGTICNPPVVIPNPITIPIDSTGMVCAPITDPDAGDTFTATSCGSSNGSQTVTVNGSEVCVTYTPNTGYTGTDSVCIIVCDQLGACDTTTIPVTVIPPLPPVVTPEPPIVIPTPITTPEDSTAMVCTPILDPNAGDTFTATICTGSPDNGTAIPTVVGNMLCVTYTPNSGFTGDDEVCVIVCDQTGLCDTIDIPVTVIPTIQPPTVVQPPIVVFPPIVTPEDSTVTTCGPVIDVNVDDTHTVTICEQPANGTATAIIDNAMDQVCVTFTPNEDFGGTDSVCIVVCDQTGLCDTVNIPIEVLPGNDPPIAIDDINVTQIDTPVDGNVLTNDEDPEGDNLTVTTTPVGTPSGGTVSINPDGTYTFTPDAGFIGEATFDYEVCDDGSPSLCDTATVIIEVFDNTDPTNNPPVGVEDNFVTEEGDAVMGSLISNDNDPDGDNLTITTTPVSTPTDGTLTINPDGTFTYTPDPNFEGADSFEYEVCDDGTPIKCDTVLVTIEVLPDDDVNDVYATDDAGMGDENMPVTGDLLANDTDPEGDNLTITTMPLDAPINGMLVINIDGTYEYTPNPNFSGTDRFVYQVCDDGTPVACDSATVYITINPVNEIVAVDDINVTQIDTPVDGNVLTNDEDPEGDNLTVTTTPVGTPSGGTVSINPDGTYTFTPTTGFTGEASFMYEVCDDGSPVVCDTAEVTIEVFDNTDPDNNDIVGVEDNFVTEEGAPVTGSLTDNDFDPDGDNLIINTTPVTSPTDGTLTINPDGTFTYTPDPDFVGEDTFEYQVCDDGTPLTCDTVTVTIEVLPDDNVNDTYATDDAGFGNENQDITGDVSSNDNDPEGHNQIVSTTPVDAPTNGTLVLNTDGTYTYTPNSGFVGNDQFIYEICDDGSPVACDTATVYLTVSAGEYPPVILPTPLTIPQDSTGEVCINILDPNAGDSFTATVCGVDNGTATPTLTGSVLCVEYTPDLGYSGTDSVCIIVCDQAGLCDTSFIPVTVVAPITPPTTIPMPPLVITTPGVTPEDSTITVCTPILDPNAGDTFTATICAGSPANGTATPTVMGNTLCIAYTPNMGFTGDDEVCVIVCDQTGLCDTVDIPITVVPAIQPPTIPQPPVVVIPPIVGPEDSITTVCGPIVDANPLDTHTVTICEQPANGTATAIVDNTTGSLCITLTPDPNFSGDDSLCVIVCDQTGLCDTVIIPITIIEINEVFAIDDINSTQAGVMTSGNVLTNDEDPEGNNLTVNTTPIGTPTDGTVVMMPNGSYTFMPDPGFTGEASFRYEVCDDGVPMACDTATVMIDVIDNTDPNNNQVIGNEDNIVTEEGVTTTFNVLSNDTDPDGDNLTVTTTPVTPPTNGTVTILPDGTVTYVPNPGFIGTETFEYEVCDDGSPITCDIVLVTIEVLINDDENDVYATDDAESGNINMDIPGSVLDNDNDPEGHNMMVTTTPISGPANGTVVLNSNGTFIYTPTTNFSGNDQFVYAVCDDGAPVACDTATVYLTILEIYYPPFIIPNPITTPQDSIGEVCISITDANIGDSFTTTICGAENGTPTATVNGAQVCIEYVPNPGYAGTDSICLIVCDQTGLCDTTTVPVTVVPPLPPTVTTEPPVVITTPITIPEDSTGMMCTPILDPNVGDTFTATLCTGSPANGTATPTVNGNELCVIYTPNSGYTGNDEVCVIICDQTGLCDTVDIPVTIIPMPEPPDSMQPPVVVMPPIIGTPDVILTACGPIADPNPGDTHTATICQQPTNGTATVAVDNATGQLCVMIDANDDFSGDDSLCVIVCDQTGLCDTVNIPITIISTNTKLELKVLLQGAMLFTSDGLMRDDLRTMGLIPLNQPYSSALNPRFTHVGGGGGETTTPIVLSQNAFTQDAVVDWIFIEIRDAANTNTVIRTVSALVQRDGDVVDPLTGTTLCLGGLPSSFHVAVKHRNHLGAMTANPLAAVNGTLVVDFTTMGDADLFHLSSGVYNYDGVEQTTMSGQRALWAGNANADNKVKYDGSANDRIKLANDVLTFPGNSTSLNLNYNNAYGYFQGDVDMNGKAKYDGGQNDRIIIQNIVLTYPLNGLILNNFNDLLEQLP